MSIDDVVSDSDRKKNRYHFDRHTPEYRTQFEKITEEIHDKCPVAWTDTYDGHWVAGGSQRGIRAGPLPGCLQRPRHQRRTPRLPRYFDPQGQARERRAGRHPGNG